MAALVRDVGCCVFIGEKTFSSSQNNPAYIWDKCCPLMTCWHLMQPHIFSTTFQTEAYGRLIQLSLAWSLFPNGWLVTSYNYVYNYNYNNNYSLCRQIKCRTGNCFLKNRQGEEKGGKALRGICYQLNYFIFGHKNRLFDVSSRFTLVLFSLIKLTEVVRKCWCLDLRGKTCFNQPR